MSAAEASKRRAECLNPNLAVRNDDIERPPLLPALILHTPAAKGIPARLAPWFLTARLRPP
jgi:hypothetical protein